MSTPRYAYTTVDGVKYLTLEGWYLNDQLHCVDGPAWRRWEVVDGKQFLTQEGWYLNGQKYRTDDPARRVWEVVDGRVVLTREGWYLNGQPHRIDGPAWRVWQVVDGIVVLTKEEWYLKGNLIHPRILRQPVRAIERWWLYQRTRRHKAIEESLWDSGMTVFPGFMGLLREY
jgi:hypothetical protein